MKYKILIVTGLSGAGRSTALKILEDIGFEAIDNLPTHLFVKPTDAIRICKNLNEGCKNLYAKKRSIKSWRGKAWSVKAWRLPKSQ